MLEAIIFTRTPMPGLSQGIFIYFSNSFIAFEASRYVGMSSQEWEHRYELISIGLYHDIKNRALDMANLPGYWIKVLNLQEMIA